jgi:proline iminopeptidase
VPAPVATRLLARYRRRARKRPLGYPPPNIAVNATASRELWAGRETDDLLVAASKIRCPVLMLVGADDPRPCAASDSLFKALPNADRTVLEGAGHAPWAEQPAATRQAILDLLSPPTGSPHRE